MKLPTYSLIKEVSYSPSGNLNSGAITFPASTSIMPMWNEGFLPAHLKEQLKERKQQAINYYSRDSDDDFVMCLIGLYWIPVLRKNIRCNY